jgi:hypothetical protein
MIELFFTEHMEEEEFEMIMTKYIKHVKQLMKEMNQK